MKKIVLAAIATVTLASTASAGCIGSSYFMSCSDGNNYSTIGNTTFGSNYNTGSTWWQTTNSFSTYGVDAGGNFWTVYH